MDVELPGDRLAGNLDLILVIDVGFVDGAATVGAALRQRRFEELIDVFGRLAMGLGAVIVAGFAAGLFGLGLGRPFGEGGGLAFAGAVLLVELLLQLDDAGLQSGDAALELLTPQTDGSSHAFTIAERESVSCAKLAKKTERVKSSSSHGQGRR